MSEVNECPQNEMKPTHTHKQEEERQHATPPTTQNWRDLTDSQVQGVTSMFYV